MVFELALRALVRKFGFWSLIIFGLSTFSRAQSVSVGVGKTEITSLEMSRGMLGYGQAHQSTAGVDLPLYARAFLVQKEPDVLAMVVLDLPMSFGILKQEVVALVDRELPGVFRLDNIVLQATHTHSAPGGYAMHDFYNLSVQGFRRLHFETIAQRIADSIVLAHSRLAPGQVRYAEGRLQGASVNRSRLAHERNPEAHSLEAATDQRMRQLVFVDERGVALGLLNWFAVHTTSMSNRNRDISGDNKGYAAYFVESSQNREFVAGFANGAEGDASPDVFAALGLPTPQSDQEKSRHVGQAQAQRAQELLAASEPLSVFRLRGVHGWETLAGMRVTDAQGATHVLCQPAVGASFAAGAEDGPSGVPGFWEGIRRDDFRWEQLWITPALALLRPLLGGDGGDPECHGQKSILISSPPQGRLLPEQLAFQLVQLGPLLLAAVPGEPTTIAGLRLEQALLQALGAQGVERVIVGGLSNDYGGYITTPEEYETQQYEGGHTLYGPHTLLGFQEAFKGLVPHLHEGNRSAKDAIYRTFTPMADGLTFPDFDRKRGSEKPGEVQTEPNDEVRPGEYAWADFRCARPNRRLMTTHDTYWLESKSPDGQWMRVPLPKLEMRWWEEQAGDCAGCNRMRVRWSPQVRHRGQIYRFVHQGVWLNERSELEAPYVAYTRPFQVRP